MHSGYDVDQPLESDLEGNLEDECEPNSNESIIDITISSGRKNTSHLATFGRAWARVCGQAIIMTKVVIPVLKRVWSGISMR